MLQKLKRDRQNNVKSTRKKASRIWKTMTFMNEILTSGRLYFEFKGKRQEIETALFVIPRNKWLGSGNIELIVPLAPDVRQHFTGKDRPIFYTKTKELQRRHKESLFDKQKIAEENRQYHAELAKKKKR